MAKCLAISLYAFSPRVSFSPRCSFRTSKNTIATPSFNKDSPNMSVYKVSVCETPTPDNIDNVATGSMDDMRDPKMRLSNQGRLLFPPKFETLYTIQPMAIAENPVPIVANNKIGNKSRRKAFLSILSAAWNMIGGNIICKNRSLSKVNLGTKLESNNRSNPPTKVPTSIKAHASGIQLIFHVFSRALIMVQNNKTSITPNS
mmetsp:Transcript_56097/g.63646  ORF Transcript_56097/g.63646 Transcript_56097/m.63646 type:complete len:202 (+) Transcript_56097:3421-4026(+)